MLKVDPVAIFVSTIFIVINNIIDLILRCKRVIILSLIGIYFVRFTIDVVGSYNFVFLNQSCIKLFVTNTYITKITNVGNLYTKMSAKSFSISCQTLVCIELLLPSKK